MTLATKTPPSSQEIVAQAAQLEIDLIGAQGRELADEHITLYETWLKMIDELDGPTIYQQVLSDLNLKVEKP